MYLLKNIHIFHGKYMNGMDSCLLALTPRLWHTISPVGRTWDIYFNLLNLLEGKKKHVYTYTYIRPCFRVKSRGQVFNLGVGLAGEGLSTRVNQGSTTSVPADTAVSKNRSKEGFKGPLWNFAAVHVRDWPARREGWVDITTARKRYNKGKWKR